MRRRETKLDERFADWVDGRLAPRDQARLEAELEVNHELRQKADAYRDSVSRVRKALTLPEPKVNLADRVLARVGENRRPSFGTLPFVASFAAAAAMVLMFFALNRLDPATQGEPVETAAKEAEERDKLQAFGEVLDQVTDSRDQDGFRQVAESNEVAAVAPPVTRPPDTQPPGTPPSADPPVELQARADNAPGKSVAAADEEVRRELQRQAQVVGGEKPATALEKSGEVLGDRLGADPKDDQAKNEDVDTWLRAVVGETEGDVGGLTTIVAQQRAAERFNLGSGQPSQDEDPAAAASPTAPVVVINLPEGKDLEVGAMQPGSGGRPAGPGSVVEQERSVRARRAPPEGAQAPTRELKDQQLQETIDQSLLVMSNAMPAAVDEIELRDVRTLQGAAGYDDDQQGRGFLVRGERSQVAQFLRQMSDWGRAQGGGVAVTEVAETVVQQAQVPSRAGGQQLGRASRAQGELVGEIEILLLFQTARRNR